MTLFRSNTSTTARPIKGMLKCFQCRQACSNKEGNWHDRRNQQVFLCKACEMTPSGEEAKQSPARRR
jgi:hypothetical protein